MVSHRLAVLLLPALACGVSSQFPVWSQEYPTALPPVVSTTLVYDSARQLTLGIFRTSPTVQVSAWDGRAWTLVPTTNAPSGIGAAGYDDARQVLVACGTQETWELRGGAWVRLSANWPTDFSVQLAYFSPARRAFEVLGTRSATLQVWQLTGTQWSLQPGSQSLASRSNPSLAYDSTRDRVVLHGGETWLADTWEWDGASWTQRFPSNSPPPTVGRLMAYDSARGRCVNWTGSGFTWEWDGDNWLLNLTAPPFVGGPMTYDARRGRCVLMGFPGSGWSLWEYFVALAARYSVFGAGCTGAAGVPQLTATSGSLPWLGDTLTCTVSNLPNLPTAVPFGLLGVSRQSWLGFTLPLSLATIGAPGCNALVSIEQTFQLTNANGSATWSVPIPWTSSLLGARFYQQALVLDPPANALGATVSNAAEAVIGDR